jgi:hypothetical protein
MGRPGKMAPYSRGAPGSFWSQGEAFFCLWLNNHLKYKKLAGAESGEFYLEQIAC